MARVDDIDIQGSLSPESRKILDRLEALAARFDVAAASVLEEPEPPGPDYDASYKDGYDCAEAIIDELEAQAAEAEVELYDEGYSDGYADGSHDAEVEVKAETEDVRWDAYQDGYQRATKVADARLKKCEALSIARLESGARIAAEAWTDGHRTAKAHPRESQ